MTPTSSRPSLTHLSPPRLSPITQRRLATFRANRRGIWSLWLFLAVFGLSLLSEVIVNDRPILVVYKGQVFVPVIIDYPETTFGGDLPTTSDFKDRVIAQSIERDGWMLWPPVRYRFDTQSLDDDTPAPAPPSWRHPLGSDDHGRDVLARLLYGIRLSVLFGVTLAVVSSAVGIVVGLAQGYFGGLTDLIGQRVIEVWSGLPDMFILIIAASIIVPGFWSLLLILLLFSWTSLVGLVRAEVLRGRNFEYVRAARALGLSDIAIMRKHVLPNAMVATLTYLPFVLAGSITALTTLDFLGLGMPPGSASLGDLLAEGKNNLEAPWLGLVGFFVPALLLSLLVFIGEAVRDAFDPRKGVVSP